MATGSRSALSWRNVPGGMPAVIDTGRYPGTVFWVDSTNSNAGDTSGHGSEPDGPFASINYAVTQCTASKGDTIIAMPGHVETVTAAGGLAFGVIGVKVIFQGEGSSRATINFTTAASADMDITAANVSLIGPRFLVGVDALTNPIHIAAADCLIKDAEWYDAPAKAAIDCVVATAAASRLVIDGWKFFASTTGTQKQSSIQVGAAANVVLKNIWIAGDFGTGNIENGTAWANVLIADVVLENTNVGPVPGITLAATATGNVVNAKVTIASGTVPITANNDMQWYDSGYSTTDASAWGTIGVIPAAGLEGKVDLVLADTTTIKLTAADAKIDTTAVAAAPVLNSLGRFIYSGGTARGTPLADSKSLVDALGTDGTTMSDNTTSIVGILGVNDADNAFVSSAVVANADGSILERLEFAQNQANKLDAVTLAAAPVAGSLARFVASGGTALGTALADSKSLVDALGSNGTTVADSATSVLGAIGANNADNAFTSAAVVANADGSALERLEFVQTKVGSPVGASVSADIATIDAHTDKIDSASLAVAPTAGSLATFIASGGVALGTALGASKSILDALGSNGLAVADSAVSVLGAVGANNADNAFGSAAVVSNADGSVLERAEYIQAQVALVKAVTDVEAAALGTNGTAVTDSAVSVLGAIGANNADNAFSSAAVVGNADGSVLERLEFVQTKVGSPVGASVSADIATIDANTDKIDSASLAVNPTAGSMARFVASGGTALGTALADSKSLVDALGTNGTTVADSATSVLGAIGANNADNAFTSAAVVANEDGSVLERIQWNQEQVAVTYAAANKIDGATLAVSPVAGSMARFVASGGTALGTPLADSKSLVDALGTNGTTLVDSATSIVGILGVDDADNTFASTNVVANEDGSILERQEFVQSKVGTLANAGGTVTLGGIFGDVANISMATRLDSATKKTVIADGTAIPNNTQAAAGLLATATNGDCYIEEIIWQRGVDNFVGPTNYELTTDNVAGLTGASGPNGVAILAKFNAAKTGVLSLDGTTKQVPFVLEATKKLYIHGDDAATSAGGTTNFYIKYRRMAANAYLA